MRLECWDLNLVEHWATKQLLNCFLLFFRDSLLILHPHLMCDRHGPSCNSIIMKLFNWPAAPNIHIILAKTTNLSTISIIVFNSVGGIWCIIFLLVIWGSRSPEANMKRASFKYQICEQIYLNKLGKWQIHDEEPQIICTALCKLESILEKRPKISASLKWEIDFSNNSSLGMEKIKDLIHHKLVWVTITKGTKSGVTRMKQNMNAWKNIMPSIHPLPLQPMILSWELLKLHCFKGHPEHMPMTKHSQHCLEPRLHPYNDLTQQSHYIPPIWNGWLHHKLRMGTMVNHWSLHIVKPVTLGTQSLKQKQIKN